MFIGGGQSGLALAGAEEGYFRYWSSQDIYIGRSSGGHLVSKGPEIARPCFSGS